MRKHALILLSVLVAASCGSSRKAATPISAEDLNTYPVQQAQIIQTEVGEVSKEEVSSSPEKQEPEEAAPQKKDLASQILEYARTFTGTPYRLGARGPKEFDCSGFTTYVFKHFGYDLPPYSVSQFREGTEVESFGDLRPGDLVFFGKRGSVRNIGHVGIVVSIDEERGGFYFIHASTAKGVKEDSSLHPYYLMRYMGARRIIKD